MFSKLQAAFEALTDRTTSEFWMTWGTVGLAILMKAVPPVAAAVLGISATIGVEPSVLVGGAIVYVVGRLSNKMANAEDE